MAETVWTSSPTPAAVRSSGRSSSRSRRGDGESAVGRRRATGHLSGTL